MVHCRAQGELGKVKRTPLPISSLWMPNSPHRDLTRPRLPSTSLTFSIDAHQSCSVLMVTSCWISDADMRTCAVAKNSISTPPYASGNFFYDVTTPPRSVWLFAHPVSRGIVIARHQQCTAAHRFATSHFLGIPPYHLCVV